MEISIKGLDEYGNVGKELDWSVVEWETDHGLPIGENHLRHFNKMSPTIN